ncbi:hypothetical protein GCM10009678_77090 [Actinomadura kijaniata]|uniref:Diadenosine tetraphosphate (Ap4A) HIT family hydrolase n=1 Tax=Actinomadura namibiensis TaxID=182080 RepID=A0A7W3LXQ9_ACTNM|nr:hypothetical protein [Actinomadura namibiensis]MBA8956269.1 diadenosine tetraphosphate (Ap4A) HIT family hydrolase [Actinomadura namibiensis]
MEVRDNDGRAGADCVLCPPLRFRLNAMVDLPGADGVLAADDRLFLMPDLAPLAEGHLLLVTAEHHACAGTFDPGLWARARRWRDHVAGLYLAAYGSADLVLFEHGPGSPQGGGACIDHAHWHLVPGTAGVRAVLEGRGLRGETGSHDALRERHRAGRSYLLVEEDDTATVHPGDGVPGQFLRWAVTTALYGPGTWRWQETFGLPESRARFRRTLETLRPLCAGRPEPVARPELVGQPERADSHQ